MTTLSIVTSALERCWTAVRTIHPDVRPAAMVVYLHQRGDRRGHYWRESWTTRDQKTLDEVHVSSHILAEGAESVMRTILHEACHSVAVTRGIKDTSRQGRWHNHSFAKLACELGLMTEPCSLSGVTTTGLKAETMQTFKNVLGELSDSIELWQSLGTRSNGTSTGKRKNTSVRLRCPSCGRIIRASRACVDLGPIGCAPCLVLFEET